MTTRLLSSLRRVTLAAEHARNVDLATPDETIADTLPSTAVIAYGPGDEQQLRGIPVVGRDCGSGAIPGTNP